jgi:hypothetical protein
MKIKIKRKRNTSGPDIWFAWYPVRSAHAIHWLERVERRVLENNGKLKTYYFEVTK